MWPSWASRATGSGIPAWPRQAAAAFELLPSWSPRGRRSSELCRGAAVRGPLGRVVFPGGPVHWRRVPRHRPGTTAGGSGEARAGMAAPLVLVVLAAVTVRAALYRSSLAVFISQRVEVASPLNAWKRGEARRARAAAPLAGPSPAGAARRGQGGDTPRAGRAGPEPGPAGRGPGYAPGWAEPCSPGPEPELYERALGSYAREEPVGGGARWLHGAGGPRGWRQRTGHRACGSISVDQLSLHRHRVVVRMPLHGPQFTFLGHLVSLHVTSDSNYLLKAE